METTGNEGICFSSHYQRQQSNFCFLCTSTTTANYYSATFRDNVADSRNMSTILIQNAFDGIVNRLRIYHIIGSMEAPSKAFLLFFLLPDWLKLNHPKSRMWFFGHFSCHICSTAAETIGMTNNAAIFGAKNVQKTTFEAAEMVLCPWNQQIMLLDIACQINVIND